MARSKKDTGHFGEEIAVDFLKHRGYRILHRNFRCRIGEIDIIAEDGETTVFVEVRMSTNPFYDPVESILWKKTRKLILLAKYYIKRHGLDNELCRFDIISVIKEDNSLNVRLIKDAFWET